jgi:hypothetical protein
MDHRQSIKEVIRHALFVLGAPGLLSKLKQSSENRIHLTHNSLFSRFDQIYRSGTWVNIDTQKSYSGLGSEIQTTEVIRSKLPGLLSKLGCETLVDVGCGDFNWLSQVSLPCKYIGCDIVSSVVAKNTDRYANDKREFIILDATTQAIPRNDVVLCREVLFHLSFEDIFRIVRNIIDSGAGFVILTSDNSIWFNSNIISGDFRNINLCRAPFSLPRPYNTIIDDVVRRGRILGVWKTSDLVSCQIGVHAG